MIELVVTEEFRRNYEQLPLAIKNKAERQQRVFIENPFHPSLETEKLNPKSREVWSFRIDRQYRIIFRFITGERVLFLTVGRHHWIYRHL
jgi:Txe/YoeB family toxin of Txe-Axe toxin-antitoxin module